MRKALPILLVFITLGSFAKNVKTTSKTFNHLCSVNKCWAMQQDVNQQLSVSTAPTTDEGWIQLHLALVEQTLRARSTKHLSFAQARNRKAALDSLHHYMLAARFPQNEDYNVRTPIFIDNHDNFCAVGYLVKATGYESVSRMIAAKTNLAYVKEMHYPELDTWAKNNGFTKDELAWIQLGYDPDPNRYVGSPLGKGVNGVVEELYPDEVNGRLYVGGGFTTVDSAITVNHITYVTESNGSYTWHTMDTGLLSTVYAIAQYGGSIVAGGKNIIDIDSSTMSSVATWDGNKWQSMGHLGDSVKELTVFGGHLYAAGSLSDSTSTGNFAVWNDTAWQFIAGLTGTINVLKQIDSSLYVGGSFSYMGNPMNAIKWSATNGFQSLSNSIKNEVKDFEKYKGEIYAACDYTSGTDSHVIFKLNNSNAWDTIVTFINTYPYPAPNFIRYSGNLSFNTLCAFADTFMVSGDFIYKPHIFIGGSQEYLYNNLNISTNQTVARRWFYTDGEINKMVVFKNSMYAGGAFTYGDMIQTIQLNGICKVISNLKTSVEAVNNNGFEFAIYPNPSNGILTIKNSATANRLRMTDMSGKTVFSCTLSAASEQIQLPHIATGYYFAQLSNNKGEKSTKKIFVKQ